jgi:hypothetical protein
MVPLAEFDEIDLSQVTILGLWNPLDRAEVLVPGEMIVDDIRFEWAGVHREVLEAGDRAQ